jgi:hypothetical protein
VNKKAFVVILILSVVVTYGAVYLDFAFNITKGKIGIPLGFSSLSLLGSDTDYMILFLDIAFWIIVIWVIWFGIKKLFTK